MISLLPAVDALLGQSVIYEEHKGDFARARQCAEERLDQARRQGSPEPLAEALLARGVVSLLQGEEAAALSSFEEGEGLVGADPARLLRFAAYTNLATNLKYATFPDGGSAAGSELDARWDGVADSRQNSPRRQALAAQVDDPAVRLEAVLVEELLVLGRRDLGIVDHERTQTEEAGARLLQASLSAPRAFARRVEGGAAPGLLAAADLAAARLCRWAHDSGQAEQFLQRAQAGYRQAGDLAGQAVCEMTRGDWLAAPTTSPVAWNFVLKEGLAGNDLGWEAESREFDGSAADPDGARQAYGQATRLFEAAGAPRGLAALRLRDGYLAALAGDYSAAAGHADGAGDAYVSAGDHLGAWAARCHAALCRVGLGLVPEDTGVARAAGTWGQERGSFSYALGLGLLFTRAGRRWLVARGDYERALACHRLAETLFRALGAASSAAQSLVDQGQVYHAIGEPGASAASFERARNLYTAAAEATPALAGVALWRAGDLAQRLYQICAAHRDTQGMARNLARLEELAARPMPAIDGDLENLTQIGGHLMAIQMLRQQIANGRVQVPRFRGKQALEVGDDAEAQRQFEQALAACRADPNQGDVMESAVLADQRRYPEAIAAFRRYLMRGGARAGFGGQMASLMETLFGQQGKALARGQDVQTLKQAAGFFAAVKEYPEARRYFDQLEAAAGPEWWRRGQDSWQSLLDYGETYEGLGEWPQALGYYDQGIAMLDEQRRLLSRDELKTALFRGTQAQLTHLGAARTALRLREAAEQAGRADEVRVRAAGAFDYAERGKARALLDLMAGSAVLAGAAPVASEALADWRRLTATLTVWRGLLAQERGGERPSQERIAYLQGRVEESEGEQRRLETVLAKDNPHFYRVLNPPAEVLSLDQVCAVLQPDTALLQYYFLGEDLLAWAITSQGMVQAHRAAIDARALARHIRSFHHACAEGGSLEGLAGPLADTLLAPLAAAIRDNSRLIVVPFGAAHLLPFHALPWEGQPLGATHTLSYLPSASALRFLRPGGFPARPDRILAVGNPARMSFQPPLGGPRLELNELRGAAREATYVASLFLRGEALVGPQATKAAVCARLGRFPLLHFATHGYLSAEAPLLSSVLLADGEALSVYELMGLRLRADLVVLSACDSGRGETTGGDEVVGLARGLLGAGARTVVVSLWPVNDVSTSLLMGAFYDRLGAGEEPAEALRFAQNYLRGLGRDQVQEALAALEDREVIPTEGAPTVTPFSHPRHWAPFLVVG
jgi:CHAT domain-containing protein